MTEAKKGIPRRMLFSVKKKVKTTTQKKYLLNASIGGYSAGSVIDIPCHKSNGIPKDKYWRKRLIDATVDNCIEVVEVVVKKDKPEEIKSKPSEGKQ